MHELLEVVGHPVDKALPDHLTTALEGLAPDLRERAVRDLALLEPYSDYSAGSLSRLIEDESVALEVRSVAAWLAGLIRDRATLPALESVIAKEEHTELAWEAAKALCSVQAGADLFRRLLFEGRSPATRRIAAYALGHLGGQAAVSDLCKVLQAPSEEPSVRGQAAEALGGLGDRSAFEALAAAAGDSSEEVRYWSVFALGELRDSRAEPILKRIESEDAGYLEGWGPIAEEAASALDELRRPRK